MVSVSLHTILLIKKYNETAHEIKPQKSGYFFKKKTPTVTHALWFWCLK